MKVLLVYILNKAGGLIYQADLSPGILKLNANDYLVIAGTLHGMHAIGSRLFQAFDVDGNDKPAVNANNQQNNAIVATGKPLNPDSNKTGLLFIETTLFNFCIFQTVTGLKFVLITSPSNYNNPTPVSQNRGLSHARQALANDIFRKIYILYADYVMKDPFYSLDMPIKSVLFHEKVQKVCA